MKRADHLFEKLISRENLALAIDEVNRTHHWRTHHRPNYVTAWVEITKEQRITELRSIIINGFEQKPPRVTERWDASAQKRRTVHEPAQWPDQYVHHAVVQVLQPIFMRGMDPCCCGSIRGRGTHYAKNAIAGWMRKDKKGTKYAFSGDIRHFYDSLQPEVVMDRMRHLIKDARMLDVIWRIVKDGIMIGAYTSQWFANVTLQPLDRLIRNSGAAAHYTRYMDNITVFGANKRKLRRTKDAVEKWLKEHKLLLKYDWQIFPTRSRMPNAVGYRYGRNYILPRKHNLLRLKRAIARYRYRVKKGLNILAGAAASILSKLGQLRHCNNRNLYRLLFRGERLVKQLKTIVRTKTRKENKIIWSMFLEHAKTLKFSKQRATATPT
ncbi:MAG: hypothetical protein ILA17_07410 [Ruminococcus sp.]|nr:hypothetical protein [Ruminiclostridium sp.]MBP1537680.1 hypothetical protein [Ruminococcus sp.]